jgi:hypothetical protein
MNPLRTLATSVLVILAGCTSPDICADEAEPPPLSSYDLSCEADADCGLAAIPNCGPCTCDDTPIRAEDAARFADEQAVCCDESERIVGTCGACRVVVARCSGGVCIAVEEE